MKKFWILPVVFTLSLPLLTACTGSADTLPMPSPTVSTSPGMQPSSTPEQTIRPANTSAPDNAAGMLAPETTMANGGVNTVQDALRISGQIADEVEKLSEIDDAEAVVAGNVAIVGVEYDAQYQGGMTDRLKEMITQRVESIDKAVTSVHVTDSMEMVSMVRELYKKIESADITFDELQTKLLDLGSTLTKN